MLITTNWSALMSSAIGILLLLVSSNAFASDNTLVLTNHWSGYLALLVFTLAYFFVIIEEKTHFRKSKPMLFSAGIIWAIIASVYAANNLSNAIGNAIDHNLLEYAELFLFLLVAMTYIDAIRERGVFIGLKIYLLSKNFGFKKLFWVTGFLAFFISPIADNLTTSLIMGAVVLAVGTGNAKFTSIAFVNIVVAANAGGAFSPFGDITTLMVWQAGIVKFSEFLVLFLPSLINFVIPAAIMHFFITGEPEKVAGQKIHIKPGGLIIVALFIMTIITAISFHNFLHLPPAMGMMTGLSYLLITGYFIGRKEPDYDIFQPLTSIEWDTLLFFFGVILSVGGLGFLGYLAITAELMYIDLGPTTTNVLIGIISAIVDNIPVMFAVLTMQPEMSHHQWLLVTLTTGVGGSLLSVGSAAGVALMGQARGLYTFGSHLKWTPVIAIGYAASIWSHLLING